MANECSPSWEFKCSWCEFRMIVGGRGAHRGDPGAGVEAALRMQEHIYDAHPGRTWAEFLNAPERSAA